MAKLPEGRPLLYYITDGQALPGRDPLPILSRAARAGVELIQIRERGLSAQALLQLVEEAQRRTRGTETQLLVNDRLEVALAAKAAGVHLPAQSLPVAAVRKQFPALLIGASCHSLEEARRAAEGGADFVVFGPVYETASKKKYGPPVGLERLAEAAGATRIPVLALGGITLENAGACLAAGAAGIAGISLFQTSADLESTVRELRALDRTA